MSDPPRQAARRAARLSTLGVSFAGNAVSGWARGTLGGDRTGIAAQVAARNAEELFAVLGELKGGAMKLGQALSTYEAMIPNELAEPYQEALIRLQAGAPAMPAQQVHRVLSEQLGSGWVKRFACFDTERANAASIGQVHRAVWHDGQEVAVKVQYPGAGDLVRADLRTLRRFSPVLARIVPGADMPSLLAELTERTAEELDYRAEAEHQRAFARALADDERIRVPAVLASAPKVIVSEWLDGTSLSSLTRTQARGEEEQRERDRIGEAIIELGFSSPARVGLLHSDPHSGNFLALSDGRVGVLDYGAVAHTPRGIPEAAGRILRLAADEDGQALLALLHSEGFVGHGEQVSAEAVLRFLGAFADPLRGPEFHFHRAFIRAEGGRVLSPAGDFGTVQAMDMPPEYLMFLRVVLGWMSILSQLDCTVATRRIVEEWVPGFVEATGAVGPG
jgi:predicted unusual protein kinase regulating ubiquinone biosynthesis (AarF/ABC1/UbiB family)